MALVTSYSSDLVVLVATMLALAGLDDERGSGSKVDFASAHERLRNRVKFLVQAGRMTMPRTKPAVLGIMDRFIRNIRKDEKVSSWHPKVSLIRYTHSEQKLIQWRFWIGSRNLTRDCSWDIGVLLIGQSGKNGTNVSGIADLGEILTELSRLTVLTPVVVRRELADLTWFSPEGIAVHYAEFRHDGRIAGLPTPPEDIEELLVISPFIDGSTIQQLGKWGRPGVKRVLLSSHAELAKLLDQKQKPTSGFEQLLFMDAPDPEDEGNDEDTAKPDEAETFLRGLHAKLICAKMSGSAKIWFGSANATVRGWGGANTEAIAEMDVDEKFYSHLREFVENGSILKPDEVAIEPCDEREDLIEDARKAITASWMAKLECLENVPILTNPVPFKPDIPGIKLEIGLITSDMVVCESEVKMLRLPPIAPHQFTQLVAVRLSIEDIQSVWVEQAECDVNISPERDQRALAHFLTPRVFLEWIRSLLDSGFTDEGGGDWAETSESKPRQGIPSYASAPWWAPSLEEVLRAWSRNPDSLRDIDRRLKAYVKYLDEHQGNDATAEDLVVLLEFNDMWEVVRRELIRSRRHG